MCQKRGVPENGGFRLGFPLNQPPLGPPVVAFYPFLGEGSPTKLDYRKRGTLILTSLLEDLAQR